MLVDAGSVLWWEQEEKSEYLMLTATTSIFTASLRSRAPTVSARERSTMAAGVSPQMSKAMVVELP